MPPNDQRLQLSAKAQESLGLIPGTQFYSPFPFAGMNVQSSAIARCASSRGIRPSHTPACSLFSIRSFAWKPGAASGQRFDGSLLPPISRGTRWSSSNADGVSGTGRPYAAKMAARVADVTRRRARVD